jgi:CxxC motif-containing protein
MKGQKYLIKIVASPQRNIQSTVKVAKGNRIELNRKSSQKKYLFTLKKKEPKTFLDGKGSSIH